MHHISTIGEEFILDAVNATAKNDCLQPAPQSVCQGTAFGQQLEADIYRFPLIKFTKDE
jgi:hypothetical protein